MLEVPCTNVPSVVVITVLRCRNVGNLSRGIMYMWMGWGTIFCNNDGRYRSFATRVLQLKIWHFLIIDVERNVCRCTFNRYSVITQFEKLAAGEQLCRRCTHRKLYHFKNFKRYYWKIIDFELWHSCRKWAIYCFEVHMVACLWIACGGCDRVNPLQCDSTLLWYTNNFQ